VPGIAIAEEHVELAAVARSFMERQGGRRPARDALDAESESLPSFWQEAADLGWMGLHVAEDVGGQGATVAEVALVLSEMGRVAAPGPYLPHVVAVGLVERFGTPEQRARWLPPLLDGSRVATVALHGTVTLTDGRLDGDAGLVPSAALADVLVLATGSDLAVVDLHGPGVSVEQRRSLDRGRRVYQVDLAAAPLADERLLSGAALGALRLARVLGAAEAAGGAEAVTEMAADYAKQRVAFGRVIGTFGPVKHHCANMLVQAELAAALVWDAARAEDLEGEGDFSAAAAASLALPGFLRCAELNIQVHGGIGYTFEHDAHLFLRRAGGLVAWLDPEGARVELTGLVRDGVERAFSIELPPSAETYRSEVRAFLDSLEGLEGEERRVALVDSGYLVPHWPKPWGREAGPIEQIVIDQEFAGVERPVIDGSNAWVNLTLTGYGTEDQKERFIRPTLMGEVKWCSMFSEPNAGSDAANVQTKGTRVEGGWLVNGQKIWSSAARVATHGLTTVRTDNSGDKHTGITMMLVEMDTPGLEVRPLRNLDGGLGFSEVFFTDVFVPDDGVLGKVDDGWAVARANFGNERTTIGRRNYSSPPALVALLDRHAPEDVGLARDLGLIVAENHAMRLLGLRQTERAVNRAAAGPEGNVTKLLAGEHTQRVADWLFRVGGPASAVEGEEGGGYRSTDPARQLLSSRGLTIGGGTSEITRNQIGERLLGLPRDPLLH
jgi:3-oxochol-4-en-24-oyl-CoA dehydrogenase